MGALTSGSALEIGKQMDKASTNLLPVELCGAVQRLLPSRVMVGHSRLAITQIGQLDLSK